MSKKRIYARNVIANWVGYGSNMLITLALSWLAFRVLGDIRYGIWSLMMSVTGYMGLVDLGLRPALYRYYNWHLGRGETDKINQVLCTSIAFFAGATVFLLVAAGVVGAAFVTIFPKTPVEYLDEVRISLVLACLSLGVSLAGAAFGALLETHERYDLTNILDIVVGLVKIGTVVVLLSVGLGLIGMAGGLLVANVMAVTGGWWLARRAFPAMELRLAKATRSMLRELLAFGIPCFVGGIGNRLILHTNAILIAWMVGLREVGYYSLAMMLVNYGRMLIRRGGTVFTPEIQQSAAREDLRGLRYFLPLVTRYIMTLGILLIAGIMTLGHEFLSLFYGEGPGSAGREVLPLLGVAAFAVLASMAMNWFLIGVGRVKFLAVIILAEAVLNVMLTVFFIRVLGMGLTGVALGTAVPALLFSGAAVSWAGIRQVGATVARYLARTASYWVPATLLFLACCYGLTLLPVPLSWRWLFGKAAMATVVYLPIGWFLILPRAHRAMLVAKLSRRGESSNAPEP